MNEDLKMILVLFFVCIISAISLSFLYTYTKPKIEKNLVAKELKLKSEVIPQAEEFKKIKVENYTDIEECYDKEKKLVGILIKSSCKGYGGDIEYIVAITTESVPKIVNLKILSHRETPGLGANVQKDKFLTQFKLKSVNDIFLKKDNINGKIDSISGATITSRAVTNSVRELLSKNELEEYLKNKIKESYIQTVPLGKTQQKGSKPKIEIIEQQNVFISTQPSILQEEKQ
ncbi:MAG: RnfABCDGE type electron transport complex subunit G [Endomicrobiia bacterium]